MTIFYRVLGVFITIITFMVVTHKTAVLDHLFKGDSAAKVTPGNPGQRSVVGKNDEFRKDAPK